MRLVQILTVSLVSWVFVEIRGFKLVKADSHLCFLAWTEADLSPD